MTTKTKRIIWAILNAIGFIGTVTINGLANGLPINGYNTGELSDMYPNLFVPAGFTFSIWGIIYLLLALFAVYQLITAVKNREEKSAVIERIGPFFLIASAANAGWIFAWHYTLVGVSLLFMLILLASLLSLYLRVDIRKRDMPKSTKWFVAVPFSVYVGWITVATIANVTALLVDLGWQGFGIPPEIWTVVVLVVATLITLGVLFTRQDLYYTLVAEWAFFGILMKRLQVDDPIKLSIIVTAAVCMAVILFDIIFQAIKRRIY